MTRQDVNAAILRARRFKSIDLIALAIQEVTKTRLAYEVKTSYILKLCRGARLIHKNTTL